MASAKAFQEEGKAYFLQKKYQEALSSYAAALSHLKESDAEKEQAAALRANRSLCCLELGDNELALAEAEQAKALRPAWPKAHFRMANALKACGRLGDARLAACEAMRLSPSDASIKALLLELRNLLFSGCPALGEALDTLEDFTRPPEEIKAAAQAVKDMLLSDVEEDVLRAFMTSAGSKTIFRRQNAMGENWQEEARNGTMSLLSQITKAGPSLEEELVRLNQEAAALENNCNAAGCNDPHAMGKAQEAKLARKVEPPPVPNMEDDDDVAFSGISKVTRRRRPRPAGVKDETSVISTPMPEVPLKAMETTLSFGPLRGLAPAAAVSQDWHKAVSRFSEDSEDSDLAVHQATWFRWANHLCPGIEKDLQITSTTFAKQVLKHLVSRPRPSILPSFSMTNWLFLLEIWRDDRRLWATTLSSSHALPGFLEDETHSESGEPSVPRWPAFPTSYERMDVLLPGEDRRSTLAGVVASLGAQAQLHGKALAVERSTAIALPLSLRAGSRFQQETSVSTSTSPLQLVLGLGARNVLPSPKAQCPAGSLELHCGLAFAGADGRWLDSVTTAALLTAMTKKIPGVPCRGMWNWNNWQLTNNRQMPGQQ